MESTQIWQPGNAETFWKEEASCSHVLQIYETDNEFLNLLQDFVSGGLDAGETVILIATPAHLSALEKRLNLTAAELESLREQHLYLPLKADEVLARFMVNDWPDYTLFMQTITEIFSQARLGNRKIRAFGEMVAILWEQGKSASTIMVEQLWNMHCEKEPFTLFCAYPKSAFPQGSSTSVKNICKHHTKIISGKDSVPGELTFQNLN